MLNEIKNEENQFIFRTFDALVAFEIGDFIAKKAMKENLPIIIDISTAFQTLYHFANIGSTANNERFIERKRNTVLLFWHSTRWVSQKVNNDVVAMHQKYGTNDNEYSILHGGFPINIQNQGVIGAICVSGLTQEEDHAIIIQGLKHYFSTNTD
jgi:uncharacterized protein (UPF0303 family)